MVAELFEKVKCIGHEWHKAHCPHTVISGRDKLVSHASDSGLASAREGPCAHSISHNQAAIDW